MEKKFAEGLCFYKLFLIFVLASILGAFYEEILFVLKHLIADGVFMWEPRRGVFYGPFSPIYGAGAVIMTMFLMKKKRPMYLEFLYAALIGGGFEYLISFLQELATGATSWDYSTHFLNINGRTTIPFMIVWGLFGIIFVKYIYPFCSKVIESIDIGIGESLIVLLIIILSIDMLVSWTAIIRMHFRKNDIEAITPIGKLYDQYYTDQYIQNKFPNMKFGD